MSYTTDIFIQVKINHTAVNYTGTETFAKKSKKPVIAEANQKLWLAA